VKPSRKLGRHPKKHDPRTLQFRRYAKIRAMRLADSPPNLIIPAAVDWTSHLVAWGMMANDRLGDCTCAAAGHLVQAWTAANGAEITPDDAAIIAMYEAACGYVAGNPETDRGGVELDVLNYWRRNPLAGATVEAFVEVEHRLASEVMGAVALFGGLYIGVDLPVEAEAELDSGLWSDTSGEPGSWGGHAIAIVGYDPTGPIGVTWGKLQHMTWSWWKRYVVEAYAILSHLWAPSDGRPSPDGFDFAQLRADLATI
jgi:hypothetical protein